MTDDWSRKWPLLNIIAELCNSNANADKFRQLALPSLIMKDLVRCTRGDNLTHENLQAMCNTFYRLALAGNVEEYLTPDFMQSLAICANSENSDTKIKAFKLIYPLSITKETRNTLQKYGFMSIVIQTLV
jgi:hypothetical protein